MTLVLRRRDDADLPALLTALGEQQPTSHYPIRWPLPISVEEFLVRPSELAAWVAELDGAVVGHVAVGDPPRDHGDVFRSLTGRDDVAEVGVLFTALAARGAGAGGALLDVAVDWIRARGLLPVLDVVPVHATALDVYRHRGWTEVGRVGPDWLPPGMPPGLPDVVIMALPA